MSSQISTPEADKLFRDSERKRKAEAILKSPPRPPRLIQSLIFGGVAAFAGSVIYEARLSPLASGMAVGLIVAVVALLIESWNTNRRLEAVIELLQQQQSPSNLAANSVPNPSFNGTPNGAR